MPPKYYYFIEDLDVTNDNIPDGVLVRQCKINIKNQIINYTKNSYVSELKLSSIISHVINTTDSNKLHKPILLSKKTINEIKNKKLEFERLPQIIISKNSFFSHLLHNQPIDNSKLVKELNNLFL
jgi:hypothetical protein